MWTIIYESITEGIFNRIDKKKNQKKRKLLLNNIYLDIQIFVINSLINFLSRFLLMLKWIKRIKLCMPIRTVHPHSVTVNMSPQAAKTNADWAKHVTAISTIIVKDQA